MGEKLFGAEFSEVIEDINQQIEMVLLTHKGEKVLDPQYGCGIWDFLDEGITVAPLLVGTIHKDVSRNVPSIRVLDVRLTEIGEDGSFVGIKLEYEVKSSGIRGFYEGRIRRPSGNME
jgi:phage baseplate assembly protein W